MIARVALVGLEVGLLLRPVKMKVALAGGVIVVEPQVPSFEPVERPLSMVRESAVEAELAAEPATRLTGTDRPLIAPGHVDPGVPASDQEGRILPHRPELRRCIDIAEIRITPPFLRIGPASYQHQPGQGRQREQPQAASASHGSWSFHSSIHDSVIPSDPDATGTATFPRPIHPAARPGLVS